MPDDGFPDDWPRVSIDEMFDEKPTTVQEYLSWTLTNPLAVQYDALRVATMIRQYQRLN